MGVESILGPLGTSASSGLLYTLRVIVRMENLVEWRLAEETEVLWENLALSATNPTWRDPGQRDGKSATNCISNGSALWH
jgi:hypothetical protein